MSAYSLPGQSATLTVMMRAAQFVAKSLTRDFEELEHLQVSSRGTLTFVQQAEQRAAAYLKEQLTKARPQYGFLAEGQQEIKSQDGMHRWIVDPLDGTNNFGHGIPYFAISIALEKDGQIVAGVVHDVVYQRCYFAEKGFGCYVNGRRLRVSGRSHLDQSTVCTNFHMSGTLDKRAALVKSYFNTASKVIPEVCSLRNLGAVSLDLAYVAAGKFEAVWLENFNIWDVAAGMILIKEAGGYVTTFAGQPIQTSSETLVAANPAIHNNLLPFFKP